MRLDVNIDTSRLQTRFYSEQRRLAYNVVEALNKTALAAQAAVRDHIAKTFHLRQTTRAQKNFIQQQIKVAFASVKQQKPFAEVYVDTKPRLVLATFEQGGLRQPFVGKTIAQPLTAGPQTASPRSGGGVGGAVKEEFTFKALRFKPVAVIPGKFQDTMQFKGALRTFILQSTAKHPLGGVFERIGPGRDDIRMVYSFAQPFRLQAVLKLVEISKAVFEDKFNVELSIAYARAPAAQER